MKLTYIACPYSHKDYSMREHRYILVNRLAGKLMNKGEIVYSPISHSHSIAIECDLPKSWQFWQKQDLPFLKLASKLVVYCLDGWRESVGVKDEIRVAQEMGMPIELVKQDADDRYEEPYKYDSSKATENFEDILKSFGFK